MGRGVRVPNLYVGGREGALIPIPLTLSSLAMNLLDDVGYGVELPAKHEGPTDGGTIGGDVGIQVGSGVGDPVAKVEDKDENRDAPMLGLLLGLGV